MIDASTLCLLSVIMCKLLGEFPGRLRHESNSAPVLRWSHRMDKGLPGISIIMHSPTHVPIQYTVDLSRGGQVRARPILLVE